jgi:hypothetical protein
MRVCMLVGSDEATSGSVIAKQERICRPAAAQPAGALRRRGEQVQQLDVAGVGRAAVEHLGRPGHAAHDLGQRRVVEVAQARAGLVVTQAGQEQVPQAGGAGRAFRGSITSSG